VETQGTRMVWARPISGDRSQLRVCVPGAIRTRCVHVPSSVVRQNKRDLTMVIRKFPVVLATAVWLAGCTSASGPTFSAYTVTLPDGGAAYRVTCYGLFEGSGTCQKKAEDICRDHPVKMLAAESRLGDTPGGKPDDRNITFQCGVRPADVTPVVAPTPAEPVLPKVVNLDADANFDTAKAVLKPVARERLDQLIGQAQGVQIDTVTVNGYTDTVGSDAYNLDLSTRRARAVADYLKDRGLQAKQFVSEGFGKSDPVDTNATAAGRAHNRRVEVRIESGQL
jgi:OmpA-OmpF porin, OOP family